LGKEKKRGKIKIHGGKGISTNSKRPYGNEHHSNWWELLGNQNENKMRLLLKWKGKEWLVGLLKLITIEGSKGEDCLKGFSIKGIGTVNADRQLGIARSTRRDKN